jgi:hypothetical protein
LTDSKSVSLEISKSTGACCTLKITDASEMSSWITVPAAAYDCNMFLFYRIKFRNISNDRQQVCLAEDEQIYWGLLHTERHRCFRNTLLDLGTSYNVYL